MLSGGIPFFARGMYEFHSSISAAASEELRQLPMDIFIHPNVGLMAWHELSIPVSGNKLFCLARRVV